MQVELKNLGKTYDGETWAVRGVDLTIPNRSIYGFIGANGAGKSTALRMIATVMAPTEGEVLLDGKGTRDNPLEQRRRIGFLGDCNPLYKSMTPAEYLRFFGQCFRLEAKPLESAIDDTLHTFDLTSKANTPCGSLSKGMRQRVLISRCLLHRPGLLILDEPADGLDPHGRAELSRILGRVQEQGVTILISSHILRELDDLCDGVAIIQRGKLIASGEVNEVIERYGIAQFVYEIRLLDGRQKALQVLRHHRVRIEGHEVDEGRDLIRVQLPSGEELMAQILSDFVSQGVRVVTVSRQRPRLEDVYERISDDQVN